MRSFLILSLLFAVGCSSAPKFPEGEVGALEVKNQIVYVYKTPTSVEGQFEYLRDDEMRDWNSSYCVKPEYYNKLHNYARDMKRYLEQKCKGK